MRACFQFTLSPVAIIRVEKKKQGIVVLLLMLD